MRVPTIALLGNRWILLVGGLVYLGLVWSVFLVVNHQEIVHGELHRSPTTVDPNAVMEMYEAFQKKEEWIHEQRSLLKLMEALLHQGKVGKAQEVSQYVLAKQPMDQNIRFHVALAWHNAGRYEEAEVHFSILLEERGEL